MRARSESVRAFSNKDEAVRFAGRQLGGHYAVYHKAQENLAHETPGAQHRAPVPQSLKKHALLLIDERFKSETQKGLIFSFVSG